MACILLTGFFHHRMTSISTTNSPTAGSYSDHRFFRYGYNRHCWSEDEKGMKNNFTWTQIGAHKKRRLSFSPQACSALVTTRNSSLTNFYQEVIEAAREKFTQEMSFQSKDKDISLAKSPGLLAALLVWLSAATLEWLCITGLRCCAGIVVLSWLLCCLCSAVLVFPAAVCSAAMLACCRAAGC